MLTSAKNTGYSEILIYIFELLSQVKLDSHEILRGTPARGELKYSVLIFSICSLQIGS